MAYHVSSNGALDRKAVKCVCAAQRNDVTSQPNLEPRLLSATQR